MKRVDVYFPRSIMPKSFFISAICLSVLMLGLTPKPAMAAGVCSQANIKAYLAKGKRSTRIHKGKFYRAIKKKFSRFKRAGKHYVGTDSILDEWNRRRDLKDPRWLAYMLATTIHETAFLMHPVIETLFSTEKKAAEYLQDHQSKSRQNKYGKEDYMWPHKDTKKIYIGRGFVQLTWHFNYERADLQLGITDKAKKFEFHPSNALDPKHSVFILYDGMIDGWFTGKCLLQYFYPNRKGHWRDARKIINGMDKASKIAGHAEKFLKAINTAQVPFDQIEIAKPGGTKKPTTSKPTGNGGKEIEKEIEEDLTLTQQLENAKKKITSLQELKAGLQTKNDLLNGQIAKLNIENSQLKARRNTTSVKPTDNEKKMGEPNINPGTPQTQGGSVALLNGAIDRLQDSIGDLKENITDLESENARLKNIGSTSSTPQQTTHRRYRPRKRCPGGKAFKMGNRWLCAK